METGIEILKQDIADFTESIERLSNELESLKESEVIQELLAFQSKRAELGNAKSGLKATQELLAKISE